MPSATYMLFRNAILGRKQMTCTYHGEYREVCPHILGHKDGEEKVLAFQFGGRSNSGPIGKSDWRCFSIAEVHDARQRDGPWRTGESHRRTQSCVTEIDIDVNR